MPNPNDLTAFMGVPITSREKANLLSGMASPAVRRISPGTKLYRVADQSRAESTTSRVDGEAGGWWVGQRAFKKMMRYCIQEDQLDRGLGYAAREACAVLFGWSSCDLLVEAYVTSNVKVFYGKGNPQSGGGTTFSGWSDVDQWFIPGMGNRVSTGASSTHVKLSAKGKRAIEVYRTCSLRSAMGNGRSFH